MQFLMPIFQTLNMILMCLAVPFPGNIFGTYFKDKKTKCSFDEIFDLSKKMVYLRNFSYWKKYIRKLFVNFEKLLKLP